MLLQRLIQVSIATALCLSALVYPWHLPGGLFDKLEAQPPGSSWMAWLYHDQLRSQLQFTHSSLLYKESITQGILLAGLSAYFALLMLRALNAKAPVRTRVGRVAGWVSQPGAWFFLLLVYLALTVTGVRIGNWTILAGSPTFHYSLRTWFAFALGLFVIVACAEVDPSRRWTVKVMAGITLLGVIVGFVALLEHLNLAGFFLPHTVDPRNRMSSLIGHNTGMSSYLMFPLSFALYFALVNRRSWVRWASWVAVALFVFVILAAQSRAIWVLAAGIVAISIWSQLRILHFRVRGKHLGIATAVLLALVAIQTVGPTWNPFARTAMPLFTRLTRDVLNLDQLQRETRLRIAVVALTELVPLHPLAGSGFGTFQYVYPPAQGRYLMQNLDTKLGYTIKRTDLAHNDYIQLLVEAGLLGCVLMLVPVGILLLRGIGAYRRAIVPQDRALLVAIALPLGAVALHALVDFPFHVVPIAMEAAVCLGLFASASVWVRKSVLASEPAEEVALVSPAEARTVRWRAVAALAAVGSALFCVPLATRNLIYRDFASDIFASDAQNWIHTFNDAPTNNTELRKFCLDRALSGLRTAIQLNVFNGQAYEGQSTAYSNRGSLMLAQARLAESANRAKDAEAMRAAAQSDLESAIRSGTNQLQNGELRYHYTFNVIGNSYRTLWLLKPDKTDIRQMNYLDSAKRAYQRAIETNVADVHSLVALSEMLDGEPLNDDAGASKYRALLFRVDPVMGFKLLLDPPVLAAQEGDSATGLQRLDHLQKSVPEARMITYARALCYFYKAVWPPAELDREDAPLSATLAWRRESLRPGEPLVEQILQDGKLQQEGARLKMLYTAARGDTQNALKLAQENVAKNGYDAEALALRDMYTEEATGKPVAWEPYQYRWRASTLR